jgi:hypothetical protein
MSFATTINIATIILCLAVLVQCARMMRSLDALKSADLPATVAALDTATGQARLVLSELKQVLVEDADPSMRALADAQAIRDELSVMVGIANATADRLLESSAAARVLAGVPGADAELVA